MCFVVKTEQKWSYAGLALAVVGGWWSTPIVSRSQFLTCCQKPFVDSVNDDLVCVLVACFALELFVLGSFSHSYMVISFG